MKRTVKAAIAAIALAAGGGIAAQSAIPEIAFESRADLLRFPDAVHMGEAAGVATNSKGDIFLYTRTGNPSISLGTSPRAWGSALMRRVTSNPSMAGIR